MVMDWRLERTTLANFIFFQCQLDELFIIATELPKSSHLIMSLTNPSITQCCARCLRAPFRPSSAAPISLIRRPKRAPAQRWQSTASSSPKVAGIVDQISQLTLLETADLVSSLKVRSMALSQNLTAQHF